jgi:hypothetical protein
MTRAIRRTLMCGAVSLLAVAGATGTASAQSATASGSASVFVPLAIKPHELCVSSNTTGRTCKDVPGAVLSRLTVAFTATATTTPPRPNVGRCAGGAVISIPSGGGSLSGSATVRGLLQSPVTVPIPPTTTPGDTVVVSFCNK